MMSILPLASVNRLFFVGSSPLGGSRSLKLPAARKGPGKPPGSASKRSTLAQRSFVRSHLPTSNAFSLGDRERQPQAMVAEREMGE